MTTVHIVCKALRTDHILPYMARTLSNLTGWSLSEYPRPDVDFNYAMPYMHGVGWTKTPWIGWFTHLELTNPPKAAQWHRAALQARHATITAPQYADILPRTTLVTPYVDPIFQPTDAPQPVRNIVGFSGMASGVNGERKGISLARRVWEDFHHEVFFSSSGRGWPGATRFYERRDMPTFYRSLRALICTSSIEGIPMPPLEALAVGTPVIIPRGVGLLDTLGDREGVYRYDNNTYDGPNGLRAVFERVIGSSDVRVDPAVVAPFTPERWADTHRRALRDAIGLKQTRGVFMVAFGENARREAAGCIRSIREFHPTLPVTVVSDRSGWVNGVTTRVAPDEDLGARTHKLNPFDYVDWSFVLYLDADTRVLGPLDPIFRPLEDGFDFVAFRIWEPFATIATHHRPHTTTQYDAIAAHYGTTNLLQPHGGCWAVRSSDEGRAFMRRWYAAWKEHATRDQPAMLRSMMTAVNLRVWWLGPSYHNVVGHPSEAVIHYPARARRYEGYPSARWDSPEGMQHID